MLSRKGRVPLRLADQPSPIRNLPSDSRFNQQSPISLPFPTPLQKGPLQSDTKARCPYPGFFFLFFFSFSRVAPPGCPWCLNQLRVRAIRYATSDPPPRCP